MISFPHPLLFSFLVWLPLSLSLSQEKNKVCVGRRGGTRWRQHMSLSRNSPGIFPLSSCIICFLRICTSSERHYNSRVLNFAKKKKVHIHWTFSSSSSSNQTPLLFGFSLQKQMVLNTSQTDMKEMKDVRQLVKVASLRVERQHQPQIQSVPEANEYRIIAVAIINQ